MTKIVISELSTDAESLINELADEELNLTQGGGFFLPAAIVAGGALFGIALS